MFCEVLRWSVGKAKIMTYYKRSNNGLNYWKKSVGFKNTGVI
jgi:hypothetical protein